MTESWRCFVAVPIGDRLRAELTCAVEPWRTSPGLGGLRWTDPAAWHVTLAFLGSVPAEAVPAITASVHDVAARRRPGTLSTGTLGAFPSSGRARVLWYGVQDPDGILAATAGELADALRLDPRGPFRPHVTLARARRDPVPLRDWLASARAPAGTIDVRELHLLRSDLGRGPAHYELIAAAPLGTVARV